MVCSTEEGADMRKGGTGYLGGHFCFTTDPIASVFLGRQEPQECAHMRSHWRPGPIWWFHRFWDT